METVFRPDRLHIAILGRCNTGKSSVLNFICGQQAAIVSPKSGTTSDPVPLPFELLPLGPVTFHDTAGLDEQSDLGLARNRASHKILQQCDLAIIVTDELGLSGHEYALMETLATLKTPFLVIFNKKDRHSASKTAEDISWCRKHKIACLPLSADREKDPARIREKIIALMPDGQDKNTLVTDLLPPRATVICVTPIDASAPKGRLILPQVQTLRELVEAHHRVILIQPDELPETLRMLNFKVNLVITDSQAVREAAGAVPPEIALTTFSLLFARRKGDLVQLMRGTESIRQLPEGASVLIAEACSHHAREDDIARSKIPLLLKEHLGHDLRFVYQSGDDFPEDLSRFALAIHCGGCMLTPRAMRRRLKLCERNKLPATNFGMVIALSQGLLERVCSPLIRPSA